MPGVGTRWGGRTGARRGPYRRFGSIRLEPWSRLPADRAPGSWGWIVIAVPRASAATSTRWKRPGSTVAAGLGTREPTGPGTATMARMAMSAMLATTLRRRTSDPTVAWMVGYGDFGAVHRVVRNVAASFQMPTRTFPSHGPLDLRRTLAPLSRGPRDPTIRLAAGPRLARVPHARRPGDRRAHPGPRGVRAEAWGPGADCALDGVPALLGLDARRGAISRPAIRSSAQLARRFPGVRIPRTRRGPRRARARPSSSRR